MNYKIIILKNLLATGCIISLTACVAGTPKLSESCDNVNDQENITQCTFVDKKASIVIYGTKNMPYALCSKAICDYDEKSQQAQCKCDIQSESDWTSASVGPSTYVSAQPTWDNADQLQTLQSNYSKANIINFNVAASSSCQFDKPEPWANCFGVRCQVQTVTKNNKSEQIAVCTCPVVKTKDFVIGYTDDSHCQQPVNKAISATYSGDIAISGNQAIMDMYQKYYPNSPSVKNK